MGNFGRIVGGLNIRRARRGRIHAHTHYHGGSRVERGYGKRRKSGRRGVDARGGRGGKGGNGSSQDMRANLEEPNPEQGTNRTQRMP